MALSVPTSVHFSGGQRHFVACPFNAMMMGDPPTARMGNPPLLAPSPLVSNKTFDGEDNPRPDRLPGLRVGWEITACSSTACSDPRTSCSRCLF